MSKAINDLVALAASLSPSGEIGNGMVAHFHELARRVMDEQGGENALAIGEHAFKAGFEFALTECFNAASDRHNWPKLIGEGWSKYDPPEEIKALS